MYALLYLQSIDNETMFQAIPLFRTGHACCAHVILYKLWFMNRLPTSIQSYDLQRSSLSPSSPRICYTHDMEPQERSPQSELNFDKLTLAELRDKYYETVGITARHDISDDEQFLKHVTSSPEAVEAEISRIRIADAKTDSDMKWWQK